MIGLACLTHELQVRDRRAGGGEDGEHFDFHVEGVETLRLAALPAAWALLAGHDEAERRMLDAAAVLCTIIAPADLEQADGGAPRSALRRAAESSPASSVGRMTSCPR